MNEKITNKHNRINEQFVNGKRQFNNCFFEEQDLLEAPPEVYNIVSWLLNFPPEQLSTIALIVSIIISSKLTLEEKAVVGSFFTAMADNIFLISAQQTLIKTARDEQKEIDDYQKMLKNKEIEKLINKNDAINKQKEQEEKEKLIDDINRMKEQIENLQKMIIIRNS